MEKKSSINVVRKIIDKDLKELYKNLNKKLGKDNPFAKFDIGAGYYVWSDSMYNWKPFIETNGLEQNIIRSEITKTKKYIAEKLGDKTSDALFTIPDDSYLYYAYDGSEIKILITGWGFKKPVGGPGGPDIDVLERPNPINLSFVFDGKPIPNYEFEIQLGSQSKPFKTDSKGIYHFNDIKVGAAYTISDSRTGKEFHLVVMEGQSQYDFDVTVRSLVRIQALLDKKPLSAEKVEVSYKGSKTELFTDFSGYASIDLPFYEDETISASMRQKTQSEAINKDGNHILFEFETEKETNIDVKVLLDGKGIDNTEVKITYASEIYSGRTDSEGCYNCKVKFSDEEICSVSVPGYDLQLKQLNVNSNLFIFEKHTDSTEPPIDTPEDDRRFFYPHILIQGYNGFIADNYPIRVKYNGLESEYKSDQNGVVKLPEMEDGVTMTVQDVLNPNNIAEYQLDINTLEYVFQVPYEPVVNDKDIKVSVLDTLGNPIQCDKVRFQQNETESDLLTNLDADGSVYFSKDTFETDKDLSVTFVGNDSIYQPVVFTLEQGENEYVLQERHQKNSWWMVLIQILAIVAFLLAVFLLLWPFLKGFIWGMFETIYY